MASSALIAVILLAGLILWLAFKKRSRHFVIFRDPGVSYFKLLLRQRGVDVSKIPEIALSEIIQAKTVAAKTRASLAGKPGFGGGGRNWRINLVRSLEAEANLMIKLMLEGPGSNPNSDAAVALTKHGVFKPTKPARGTSGMTLEQFSEAARRGTLYSELSDRRSKH